MTFQAPDSTEGTWTAKPELGKVHPTGMIEVPHGAP